MSLANLVAKHKAGTEPALRDVAELLEIMQQDVDRLGEMIDDLPPHDMRVVIRVDGQGPQLRLADAAKMAKYITELPHE